MTCMRKCLQFGFLFCLCFFQLRNRLFSPLAADDVWNPDLEQRETWAPEYKYRCLTTEPDSVRRQSCLRSPIRRPIRYCLQRRSCRRSATVPY